jgi:hypothetical protein
MARFADRTGPSFSRSSRRYLWTDAFAVCNFLGMARLTGEDRYRELALRLVDQVHHTLGMHRPDDRRTGWLPGADETHPTRGGLRIGKPLRERLEGEPFDAQLEWERDGQYFHYLTKWMHALDQVSRSTREPRFNRWARELAEAAFIGFSPASPADGQRRLVWKMSVDLSRPLVPSMGQHDALDGFITCTQLRTTASIFPGRPAGPGLERETAALAAMSDASDWTTSDPLGIGGLLSDAWRVRQLMSQGALEDTAWLARLLAAALAGLQHHAGENDLRQPAAQRLAFRELGLAIGLTAIGRLGSEGSIGTVGSGRGAGVSALLQRLDSYRSLGSAIERFWLDREHRETPSWSAHRDINEVMLATALMPEGFLDLSPAP